MGRRLAYVIVDCSPGEQCFSHYREAPALARLFGRCPRLGHSPLAARYLRGDLGQADPASGAVYQLWRGGHGRLLSGHGPRTVPCPELGVGQTVQSLQARRRAAGVL